MNLLVFQFSEVVVLPLFVRIAKGYRAEHYLILRNPKQRPRQFGSSFALIDMTPARTDTLLCCCQENMLGSYRTICHPGVVAQRRIQRNNNRGFRGVEHLRAIGSTSR